jgi:hypothetical protein
MKGGGFRPVYSARSLRRYQERFAAEGIQALVRKPGRLRAAVPAVRKSGDGIKRFCT